MKVVLAYLAACGVAGLLVGYFLIGGGKPQPTPLHATSVFFDGINQADLRETCSVQELPKGVTMGDCESHYVGILAFLENFAVVHYTVVPHSEKTWTTGRIDYATVLVHDSSGQTLKVHLRDRGHGWKVWAIT